MTVKIYHLSPSFLIYLTEIYWIGSFIDKSNWLWFQPWKGPSNAVVLSVFYSNSVLNNGVCRMGNIIRGHMCDSLNQSCFGRWNWSIEATCTLLQGQPTFILMHLHRLFHSCILWLIDCMTKPFQNLLIDFHAFFFHYKMGLYVFISLWGIIFHNTQKTIYLDIYNNI